MASIKSGSSTDQWDINAYKAGKVVLYDASGNPIKAEIGWSGNSYLGVCMNQDVETSIKNTNLSASITASGTWGTSSNAETTLGIVGIQINSYLTQAHTVTLYQSFDGINYDINDSYDVPASFGVAHTFQAVGSSFYVKVTNSGSTTATGRIATFLCPVVEAVPRALTKGGNLKASLAAEWQSQKQTTGLYSVCTPRTIGSAGTPQNLFVLQNPSSTYCIAIRSLNVITNTAGTNTAAPALIRVSRGTSVSGGTSWTANITKYYTADPSPQATCLVATTADDAALTTITATAGTSFYQQCMDKAYTQVGWFTHPSYPLVPDAGADLRQLRLAPGENMLVQAQATAIPANQSTLINCVFSEMLAL